MPRSETPTLVARDGGWSMAQEWYIDADGRVEGPVPVGELRDRAATGRLRPTDRVSADRVQWVPAGTVSGLTFPTPKPRQALLETVVASSVRPGDPAPATGPSVIPVVSVRGYKLLDTLGSGAYGVVYKALHEELKRVVALKTVLMPDRSSADLIDRFRQEAVALARLQHPNIVSVFDSGPCTTPSGQVYFAMELLDGEDLAARIDRAGPLDERTAWLVARQTAAALAHAAKHGVVHRDVKPANLFLVPPPTGFPLPPDVPMVKVTDFGLALTRGSGGDPRQTAAGVLVGTPVYMAPEQFAGSDVDSRADVYSLGATVYHALTGHPPFDGRTVWEVMQQKSGPAPHLAPPVSAATADLVAAMMAADAAARPADYADLIARIDALPFLEGPYSCSVLPTVSGRIPAVLPPTGSPVPALVPPPALPPPARRRGRWVYGVAAVLLVGAAVGIAAVSGAFNRPVTQMKAPDVPDPSTKRATYVTGEQRLLYVSESLMGWTPDGGFWEIEQDKEMTQVIAGKGGVVRALSPPPNFRVTLSLDPQQASTVEVVVAVTGGPPASETRWLVRVDQKDGVAFGKRVGAGAFEPVGAVVPLPTPKELADESRRPYLEIRYERSGGTLAAWFRGHSIGRTPDAGLRTTEFRLHATGGPVRIDYAALDELVEQK
jgi:serine/threonine protein kinase